MALCVGAVDQTPVSTISGFRALDAETVKDYLAEREELGSRVGPSDSKASWKVSPSVMHMLPASLHCDLCRGGSLARL
jgi:hypothetical protein